jgi:hypothetical protein
MRNEYTILIPKAEEKILYGQHICTQGEKLKLIMKEMCVDWIYLIRDKTSDRLMETCVINF